ncbi:MAG: NAD-dependent epimerase/dehydratase family protein [Candidatus Hermodarchaeota archaeon]
MNLLITGGGGYLGCVLIPLLLEQGHNITCMDKLFFGEEPLKSFIDDIKFLKEDIRTFNPSILDDIDICVNLAAISQPDQAEVINPKLYYEINHYGCVRLAKLCKEHNIKRFIFTSTCSVYGFQNEVMSEASTPKALEAYGKSKLLAEQEILPLADENFIVTILRPATMYGFSSKMRFDLVVNGMTWALHKFGKINVMRDGTQWRPNVHVKDVALLISKLIDISENKIQREIFNVGSNEQNYQILPLAKVIGDSIEEAYELDWYGAPDTRSYKVDFSKLQNQLGFNIQYSVKDAVKKIYNKLSERKTIKSDKTSVISWYKKLSEEGSIKLLNN